MSARGKHGGPMYFKCPSCGAAPRLLMLSGETKPNKRGGRARADRLSRQYTCMLCRHTGWSAHIDLIRYDAPTTRLRR